MRDERIERAALSLFTEALEHEGAALDHFINTATAGDPPLRDRLKALLAADRAQTELEGDIETADLVLPPSRLGAWRLDRLIGAGGMGSVYRGLREDGLFEQTVAIKVIRTTRHGFDFAPLIDAERRLLARMDHEGIARILDGGQTETGLAWFAMEFVEGVPIDSFAPTTGSEGRIALVRQVATALAHAHRAGIVHCDIKPDNILVTDVGRTKLIDFGIARVEALAPATTLDGATRDYASPQRLAREPATAADDVYSLAVTLFEMLTGRLPWADPSRADPAAVPAALPALGLRNQGDLEAIIARALSVDPLKRYRDAAAFEAELMRWQAAFPVEAVERRWPYLTRRLVQRRPVAVAAGALAAVGITASLIVISMLYVSAESARGAADKRFADLRQLAGFMLFDLNTTLEQVPGATPARAAMANQAQAYLDGLAATSQDNPALQREAAIGLTRLAEVQGVPSRPNLGEGGAAEANLTRAIATFTTLIDADATDLSLFEGRARARYHLAVLKGSREQDGAAQLDLAEEAETDLEEAGGADTGARASLLLGIRLTQADALTTLGRADEALRLRESEDARISVLPESIKAGMLYPFDAGRAAAYLADSYFEARRLPEAQAAYGRAITAFEQGLEGDPLNRQALSGLHYAHYGLSATKADAGDPEGGLQDAQASLEIGNRLVGWDPTDRLAQRLVHVSRGQVALMLRAVGRLDEALAMTEAQIATARSAASAAPGDGDAQRTAVVALRSRAELILALNGQAAGCSAYAEALSGWVALGQTWGLSALDRQNDVATIVAALEANNCT